MVAVGVCGAVAVASAVLPAAGLGFPTCLFRAVTTLPCPSCGMTRAFCALTHGDVADAVRLNAASPLVYCACAMILALGAAQTASGADLLGWTWDRTRRWAAAVTIGAMAAAWAAKLFA